MEMISRKPSCALLKGPSQSGKRLCLEIGAHTYCGDNNSINNVIISFSSFNEEGAVKTHEDAGKRMKCLDLAEAITHVQYTKYKNSGAQFRSPHNYPNEADIDMEEFLEKEKTKIARERDRYYETNLFLIDLPLRAAVVPEILEELKGLRREALQGANSGIFWLSIRSDCGTLEMEATLQREMQTEFGIEMELFQF